MKKSPPPIEGTPLNLGELRIVLSDSIRALRAGTTSAASANAISNAVGKVLSSVKLEMEYARLTGRKSRIPLLADSVEPEPGPRPGP